MSLITRMRYMRAVWWKRSNTAFDEEGRPAFDSPVEIKCRWEDKKGTFRNEAGEIFQSEANVYVDRELSVGDRLKKGEMTSNSAESPVDDRDAHEIVGFEIIPWIKNKPKKTLFVAHL